MFETYEQTSTPRSTMYIELMDLIEILKMLNLSNQIIQDEIVKFLYRNGIDLNYCKDEIKYES